MAEELGIGTEVDYMTFAVVDYLTFDLRLPLLRRGNVVSVRTESAPEGEAAVRYGISPLAIDESEYVDGEYVFATTGDLIPCTDLIKLYNMRLEEARNSIINMLAAIEERLKLCRRTIDKEGGDKDGK